MSLKCWYFAKEHNFEVISHPIEIGHIDCYETLDEEEFITEIQIPVKPLKNACKIKYKLKNFKLSHVRKTRGS